MKEELNNLNENKTNDGEEPKIPQEEKVKYQISIAEKWQEIMKAIKDKTGFNGIYVIIVLLICVFLVYLGIFGTLMINIIGTIYPGWCTIKAMDKNIDKKEWLTYWAVFGSFLIVDMFSNIIIKIIPFYFVFKLCFLLWMILPGSNGCRLVYNFLIYKLFKSVEDWVDFFFSESQNLTKEFIREYKLTGFKKMKQIQQGFKVFGGTLLKKRLQGNMLEAQKAAQEMEKEMKNSKDFSHANHAKNGGGLFSSISPSFPKRMERKYFKEEIEEISKNMIPETQNEEKKEENIKPKKEEIQNEDIQLSFLNIPINKDNNLENKDNNEDKKEGNKDNNEDDDDLESKFSQFVNMNEPQKEKPKEENIKTEEKIEACKNKEENVVEEVKEKTDNVVGEVKKESDNVVEEVKEKTDNVVEEVKEKTDNVVEEVKEKTDNVVEEVKKESDNVVEEVKEKTDNVIEEVKKESDNVVEEIEEKTDNVVEEVKEKTDNAVEEVKKETDNVVEEIKKEKNNEKPEIIEGNNGTEIQKEEKEKKIEEEEPKKSFEEEINSLEKILTGATIFQKNDENKEENKDINKEVEKIEEKDKKENQNIIETTNNKEEISESKNDEPKTLLSDMLKSE